MKDTAASILASAGLVLTISLAVVTTSADEGILAELKWPIVLSSLLLAVSIFFGIATLSAIIQHFDGKKPFKRLHLFGAFQLYSFLGGLLAVMWGVLVRVGVI